MNITNFIKYLNETKKWNIQGKYYTYIDQWRAWWQGFTPEFHTIREIGLDGETRTREMYRMRMPKRACEDWASLLLNDKTFACISDKNSSDWLIGPEGQQTGGILRQIDFWTRANELVELTMRSGTGAFVMSLDNLKVEKGAVVKSPDAVICMDYDPAECILPLTISHGRVVDIAFAAEVTIGGNSCIYLQTHQLITVKGVRQYRITNEYFTSKDEEKETASYAPTTLPDGVIGTFTTGSDVPWFAIITPNVVKNISGGPGLGMAVFAEALDQAKQCDAAFDNYHRDIFLGGKKVFYNKRLLNSYIDKDGKEHFATPDDVRQSLFVHAPGNDPDDEPDWHEYNPDLRVDDNSKAVQDALDYFSFKVGLGTHHYQFSAGNIATATQYNGDRQDMVQHANKHQIKIEAALLQIFKAMLWAGKVIMGQPVNPDAQITINFDDRYIADADTRRKWDQEDALNGFLPKYRYNMEWRGMSEQDAKKAVTEASNESGINERLQFESGDA